MRIHKHVLQRCYLRKYPRTLSRTFGQPCRLWTGGSVKRLLPDERSVCCTVTGHHRVRRTLDRGSEDGAVTVLPPACLTTHTRVGEFYCCSADCGWRVLVVIIVRYSWYVFYDFTPAGWGGLAHQSSFHYHSSSLYTPQLICCR